MVSLSSIAQFGAAQGLMLALSILTIRYGNRRANFVLAAFVLVESIRLYVLSLIYAPGPHSHSLIYSLLHLSYAIGPLLYFYVRLLVGPNYRLSWRSLLHFIPIVLGFLLFLPGGPISDAAGVQNTGFDDMPVAKLRASTFGTIPVFISLFVYSLMALQHLQQHSVRIRQEFSDLAEINLRWLQGLVCFCLVSAAVSGVSEFLRGFLLWDMGPRVAVSMLMTVLLLYGIGLFGLRQPVIFDQGTRQQLRQRLERLSSRTPELAGQVPEAMEDLVDETESQRILDAASAMVGKTDDDKLEEKYQKTGLDEAHVERLWQNLCALMHSDKPYLQPGLKLAELAALTGTRSNYLSQVINSCAQQNFFEYINQHRVEASCQLLLEQTDESIADIALLVGFGSLSVFNTNFKKIVGKTPTQYRQQGL